MMEPADFAANNAAYLQAGLAWLRALLEERRKQQQLPVPVETRRSHWFWNVDRSSEPSLMPAQPGSVAQAWTVQEARTRLDGAANSDPPPALVTLADKYGLTDFERHVVLLCAAMELDPKFPHQIAAAAHHAPAIGAPSFGLALDLFEQASWDALSPARPLRRLQLIEIHQAGASSLLTAPLRIDERIAAYVKGLNYLDERLSAIAEPISSPPHLPASHQALAQEIASRVKSSNGSIQIELVGQDRSSKRDVAAAALALGESLLLTIAPAMLPSDPVAIERFVSLWERESALLPIALLVAPPQAELAANAEDELARHWAGWDLLRRLPGVLLLDIAAPSAGTNHILEVNPPSVSERRALWAEAWPDGKIPDDSALDRLAGEFAMPASRIHAAIESGDAGRPPSVEQLWSWCVAHAGSELEGLAERIEPRTTLDQVKLPGRDREQLDRLIRHGWSRGFAMDAYGFSSIANRGLGLAALFHGESGTGKTMAAEAMAHELGLALYRVDLASVMSKYIGDTTKKLRSIFNAADGGGVMLLFDEADAVFGKRSEVKDSHDRYANIDINYLLSRMEAFAGITILATNMKHALDPAFLRRLRFVVGFGFPGLEEREAIWRGVFPVGAPLEPLDYAALARFPLTGGSIFNVALGSAHEAAADGKKIGMRHVLTIIRAEMQKLERPMPEREFALLHDVSSGAQQ
jgi:hypothetical protein